MTHPVISLVFSVTLLVGLALPYFDIKSGSIGVSGLPEGTETRAAYEILQREFAAGRSLPSRSWSMAICPIPRCRQASRLW